MNRRQAEAQARLKNNQGNKNFIFIAELLSREEGWHVIARPRTRP